MEKKKEKNPEIVEHSGSPKVDLSKMTDINMLKAMAYNLMKNMAIYQRELQMIETRINQLEKNVV